MSNGDIPWEEKVTALDAVNRLREEFLARGWFPASSGSLSVRIGGWAPDRYTFAVTVDETERPELLEESSLRAGVLFVDAAGEPCEPTRLKPSPDTPVHARIYRLTGCGAIVHVHTAYNNLLSEYFNADGGVPLKGNELLKRIGIWETSTEIRVPILPNAAELSTILKRIAGGLDSRVPAFLLQNHGIYAWGSGLREAKRHLEALEFMFEVLYRSLLLPSKGRHI
ncbi:methylthioribulose 1-phosphate dehydratase [Paenibacillus sp. DXFW5]|uniref:Methylthioribulose-1-phosphate dehydratase n=1 Tax=Paenibacillus rhizolycopersici TaxID=2780073 RepID=A0ABS2H3P7_9BACL|nr:methylthioribulose 1-phosphate dehydratase [Paenibacillus rhizolycopersici]MBM6995431.1 methylthioribulose 1-phosphate dehydratase [Paenibacillus rhizolycopersici]